MFNSAQSYIQTDRRALQMSKLGSKSSVKKMVSNAGRKAARESVSLVLVSR